MIFANPVGFGQTEEQIEAGVTLICAERAKLVSESFIDAQLNLRFEGISGKERIIVEAKQRANTRCPLGVFTVVQAVAPVAPTAPAPTPKPTPTPAPIPTVAPAVPAPDICPLRAAGQSDAQIQTVLVGMGVNQETISLAFQQANLKCPVVGPTPEQVEEAKKKALRRRILIGAGIGVGALTLITAAVLLLR